MLYEIWSLGCNLYGEITNDEVGFYYCRQLIFVTFFIFI